MVTTLDNVTDSITCPHCGVHIYVDDFWPPVSHRIHAADEYEPRTCIIIGNNRLVHSCELPEEGRMTTNGSGFSAQVGHAQGMVAAQASCSMDAALALMQNTADATDETLDSIAAEVLNRRVRFDPPL